MDLILPPETLDAVFRKWLSNNANVFFMENYQYIKRNSGMGKKFESWLWDQGMMVHQRDRKRYLVSLRDDKYVTLFLIKNL